MKTIKIAVISIALVFSFLMPAKEAKAFTEIFISNDDCTITILLRKEFRVLSRQTLDDWLRQVDEGIANAQAVLNPGWLQRQANRFRSNASIQAEQAQAQADLSYYTAARNKIQNIINTYTPMTDAEAEALAQKWKNEIETKWNAQNYLHDGNCRVRVVMAYVVSKETDPPKRGFDQIKIVPGDFRSHIKGVGSFNADGFSEDPYNHDVTGMWTKDTEDNYTAPHEAGHEMGLNDRYTDIPGDGYVIDAGYEFDLMGGAPHIPNGSLVVESTGTNGLHVNNLKTILDNMSIRCPPGCTPQNPRALIDFVPGPAKTGGILTEKPEEKCTECPPPPKDVSKAAEETAEETKPAEDAAKPAEDIAKKPTETVQYSKDKIEDVATDTAIVTKDTPQGKEIDVSALPTGKGIDFRKWEVKDITLLLDGQKVKPVKKDNFYVDKESYFRGAAATVITAIGIAYSPYVKEAESGEVCHVTGKESESKGKGYEKTPAERAAVAAGIGLLASQAKGTITGKKCSFNLDKNTADKLDGRDDYARVTVMLEDRNITRTINVPLKGK